MHHHHRSLRRPLRTGLWLERHLTTQQFTFAQLWRMFVPLVFDQLFIYLINILSVSMVSSSGEAAVAAVSMVGSLGMIISAVFAGLSTGGSILVAQARGAQDDERVRQWHRADHSAGRRGGGGSHGRLRRLCRPDGARALPHGGAPSDRIRLAIPVFDKPFLYSLCALQRHFQHLPGIGRLQVQPRADHRD